MIFNTTKLAEIQDICLEQLKNNQKVSEKNKEFLISNNWIELSRSLAPNNLVVRNDCILDIIEEKAQRKSQILIQLNKILKVNGLWAEGYSYWLYTKEALNLYSKKFKCFQKYIENIDENFLLTSYKVNDILYPAPFGDLRKEPLENILQKKKWNELNYYKCFPIEKQKNTYFIEASPVGMNTHCPKENQIWIVKLNGDIVDRNGKLFPWYNGYNNKYKNKIIEIKDVLSSKRVLSIFKKH